MEFLLELVLGLSAFNRRDLPADGLFRLARWTGAAFIVIGWGILFWLSANGRAEGLTVFIWGIAVLLGALSGPLLMWARMKRRYPAWQQSYPLWVVLLVIASGPAATMIWALFFWLLVARA